jgi:hypothetical protein
MRSPGHPCTDYCDTETIGHVFSFEGILEGLERSILERSITMTDWGRPVKGFVRISWYQGQRRGADR